MDSSSSSTNNLPTPPAQTAGLESDDILRPAEMRYRKTLLKLYTSHFLSTWNSRTFEFAAVQFLAVIAPGTLFYASTYALMRSLAASLLSTRVGTLVDRSERLMTIRSSIIWQRVPVALSCIVFGVLILLDTPVDSMLFWILISVTILLACVEKLAAVGNTVAIERDWVVVISQSTGVERGNLNAIIRRIDLLCKLLAPLLIALVQSYSTIIAIGLVFSMNVISVPIEYVAIAQVYRAVPELCQKARNENERSASQEPGSRNEARPANTASTSLWSFLSKSSLSVAISPWLSYFTSPVFLPSFSLSLLYLTVLSTGVQYQTYMLSIGYSPVAVSLLRFAAVASELSATWINPFLTRRIGGIRSGLWSINWQVVSLAGAVICFELFENDPLLAGAGLTAGIVTSRLGLWGFDLSVQDIVQEGTPEHSRGEFSASELALQNLFELLSFASTIVFPRPNEFQYPISISFGAVVLSATCFAGFVRKERGHLLHMSKCMNREKYHQLSQEEQREEVVLNEFTQRPGKP